MNRESIKLLPTRLFNSDESLYVRRKCPWKKGSGDWRFVTFRLYYALRVDGVTPPSRGTNCPKGPGYCEVLYQKRWTFQTPDTIPSLDQPFLNNQSLNNEPSNHTQCQTRRGAISKRFQGIATANGPLVIRCSIIANAATASA